jgi:hypothetical protein
VAVPVAALTKVFTRYELPEPEGIAVRRAWDHEPGPNLYAIINALTRAGNDTSLPLEARHRLQALGGRITDLSATGRWLDN